MQEIHPESEIQRFPKIMKHRCKESSHQTILYIPHLLWQRLREAIKKSFNKELFHKGGRGGI